MLWRGRLCAALWWWKRLSHLSSLSPRNSLTAWLADQPRWARRRIVRTGQDGTHKLTTHASIWTGRRSASVHGHHPSIHPCINTSGGGRWTIRKEQGSLAARRPTSGRPVGGGHPPLTTAFSVLCPRHRVQYRQRGKLASSRDRRWSSRAEPDRQTQSGLSSLACERASEREVNGAAQHWPSPFFTFSAVYSYVQYSTTLTPQPTHPRAAVHPFRCTRPRQVGVGMPARARGKTAKPRGDGKICMCGPCTLVGAGDRGTVHATAAGQRAVATETKRKPAAASRSSAFQESYALLSFLTDGRNLRY
ncbi:hypothetical protein BC567DRAFT_60063 [Phyllosticta citribraziliensis]